MNKLETAARQALEALETCETGNWSVTYDELAVDEAITALREALAEQEEQEPVAEALRLSEEAIEYARQGGKIGSGIYGKALAAIRSAKEPQITTPDVCGEVCVRAKLCYGCGKALDEANAKFTEQAEQEPVAWIEIERCIPMFAKFSDKYKPNGDGFIPLYAAPVRTKDLTDDEIVEALGYDKSYRLKRWVLDDARAVIAADREKNRG